MIITKEELDKTYRVVMFGHRFWDAFIGRYICTYFANNPHLFLTQWFDEYRWYPLDIFGWRRKLFPGVGIYRSPHGDWLVQRRFPSLAGACPGDYNKAVFNFDPFDSAAPWRSKYRSGILGLATWTQAGYRLRLGARLSIEVDRFFDTLSDLINKPPIREHRSIVSPKLWTPTSQCRERILLKRCAEGILKRLYDGQITLADVSWRQLEDLVAEILTSRGLEVHRVSERPQGGRDIIFRGELIPGLDPISVAVEVKHRDTVGVAELSRALHQNRYYPALLFVTSGRFTAGVYQERENLDSNLRLFLKDGVALGDMIRMYGLDKGWKWVR